METYALKIFALTVFASIPPRFATTIISAPSIVVTRPQGAYILPRTVRQSMNVQRAFALELQVNAIPFRIVASNVVLMVMPTGAAGAMRPAADTIGLMIKSTPAAHRISRIAAIAVPLKRFALSQLVVAREAATVARRRLAPELGTKGHAAAAKNAGPDRFAAPMMLTAATQQNNAAAPAAVRQTSLNAAPMDTAAQTIRLVVVRSVATTPRSRVARANVR